MLSALSPGNDLRLESATRLCGEGARSVRSSLDHWGRNYYIVLPVFVLGNSLQ